MRKPVNIKKLILPNLPYVVLGLLATNLGEAWRLAEGADASAKILSLLSTLGVAFQNPMPSFQPLDLVIGLCCGAALRLAVYLKGKNAKKFRKNEEYGSARWGTHEDISPYIDPVYENNIILTQTESLTMNSRPKDPRTARNKNVLVVGGSGSGKTRFFIKPNIMQLHSSYCITDPNGTEHIEELEVDFFDYDPPEIRAGIDGSLLKVEAFDERSGMAGIYVNDALYTTLKDGALHIRIDGATEELFFYIQGEDMLGNLTDYVVLANPFYEEDEPELEPEPDKDNDHGIHCAENCDCRKPYPPSGNTGNSGNGNSTGNSNGGGNTGSTQKPVTPPAKSESTNKPVPETEAKPTEIEKGEPLSTNSSAVTRDLLYDKYTNKQFITVETRNGEILYLVIDYDKPIDEDGEQYETYFLNLVDEADLLALVEDKATVPVCSCKDKCEPGVVNMSCEVCKNNMTECVGKEKVKEPEHTVEPEPEPEKKDSGSGGMLMVVLLLAMGGGGALYWFKFRKNKPDTKGPVDLDDYDYGDEDDDEDYETEPYDAKDDAENM